MLRMLYNKDMEHNAHEYTECPKCGDTVLDLNMLYDADGSTVLHCTNCAWEMGHYDSPSVYEDYDPYSDVIADSYEAYEPNPYDGTYSEM